MQVAPSTSLRKSFLLLLSLLLSHISRGISATAIHSPLQDDGGGRRYEVILDSDEENNKGLPYGMYFDFFRTKAPPKVAQSASSLHHHQSPSSSEKRERLAQIMKKRYRQFRQSLEDSSEKRKPIVNGSLLPKLPMPSNNSFSPSDWSSRTGPPEEGSSKQWYETGTASVSSGMIIKRLRSAEEGLSPLRVSALRPELHPFPQQPLRIAHLTSDYSTAAPSGSGSDTASEDILVAATPTTFDPSIVVDVYTLLQITKQPNTSQREQPPTESYSRAPIDINRVQVLVQPKTRATVKVTRRKLPQDSVLITNERENHSTKDGNPVIQKRAKYLQLPSNVASNSTASQEELSLYISTRHEEESREQMVEVEQDGEFGPYSQGNDPNAGVHPSQVAIPDLDLSQLRLPQGVRDSLRKYLKPLISALKPLRKSVPGLPGLDYPILNVVPYTNFYCSNMPWPGFYADTEARCQTWHACDVDGRQSTFLCPNGTVFNQALMVCDWWYNADCLAAPFLYPLNERIFGTIDAEEAVKPQTRITPELLDTIFV